MNLKKGPKGSILDVDGNLFFPNINEEKLKIRKGNHQKVRIVLEKEIEEFSPERIKQLIQFKKDLEDLKKLEKIEKNKKHLEFIKEQEKEINKYFKSKNEK